jgi:hypothetical protein
MHDMIRQLSYDPRDLEAFPSTASTAAVRLLGMAPFCVVSAALVHMAQCQQVCLPVAASVLFVMLSWHLTCVSLARSPSSRVLYTSNTNIAICATV